MNCQFVSFADDKLTVNCQGTVHEFEVSGHRKLPPSGTDEHGKPIPALPERRCEVTRDGQACDVASLRRGDKLRLDGKPVIRIVAASLMNN